MRVSGRCLNRFATVKGHLNNLHDRDLFEIALVEVACQHTYKFFCCTNTSWLCSQAFLAQVIDGSIVDSSLRIKSLADVRLEADHFGKHDRLLATSATAESHFFSRQNGESQS